MEYSLIKPTVTLLSTWGSEDVTAAMADVIYRGYSIDKALERVKGDQGIVKRRILSFLRDGHSSVFEFMGAQWLIEGSRALTHELIRHRLASYWQESQRYVDYAKGQLRFITPPGELSAVSRLIEFTAKEYVNLRSSQVPEDARYILPNAMASRIWVQMNAREFFLNFIPLRTGLGAFHEIRLVAWLMFTTVIDKFPITARWIWINLTKLHPDYCRGVEKLSEYYGTSDCRIISIRQAFEKWGLSIPISLGELMNEEQGRVSA
ncbi:FAD-dependent thymidylate synthase [Caldivirga maquilingensis]|uniref:FAD-dependent thymidylate synthase n=1 Tax=Caldivirga maquilingensis TaxID=76887 RepID=UPI001E282B28|nr:FAD-dependent thymidylate synthase [Caldivirga maquilingensis]